MRKYSPVQLGLTGMKSVYRSSYLTIVWGLLVLVLSGCSATIHAKRDMAPSGTRLTLPSYYETYYSSPKARALGEIHSRDLERLTDRLVQGPIGQLQFANAVVSVSMGFFTYANSQPPDQRYLEVILGMPDILDDNSDYNVNIHQLFAQYGRDLLTILASDRAMANDEKIAGYGLNFSWRSVVTTPSGPRMTLNEAVMYIGKEQTEKFLHWQVDQDTLLRNSALFFRKGEQAAKQVKYLPPAPQPQVQVFAGQAVPLRLQPQTNLLATEPSLHNTTRGTTPQFEFAASRKEVHKEENPLTSTSRIISSPQKNPTADEPLSAPKEETTGSASSPATVESGSVRSQSEYIVQLWYAGEEEAQRWANLLGVGGYTTSLEGGDDFPPVRLRVGRFASLVDATHFLDHFKVHGTQGQILRIER